MIIILQLDDEKFTAIVIKLNFDIFFCVSLLLEYITNQIQVTEPFKDFKPLWGCSIQS